MTATQNLTGNQTDPSQMAGTTLEHAKAALFEAAHRRDPMHRGHYGQYVCPPDWAAKLVTDAGRNGSWEEGIASDERGSGTAINTDIYSYDADRGLVIVQVRECQFGGRYRQVRKAYYLVGRNENGNVFAHPVEIRAAGRVIGPDPAYGVLLALSRIWRCEIDDLSDIVRNGDVALVPVSRIPAAAVQLEEKTILVRDTHRVCAQRDGIIYRHYDDFYVRGYASIEHTRGQHPRATATRACWRVQAGVRADTWDFTAASAD